MARPVQSQQPVAGAGVHRNRPIRAGLGGIGRNAGDGYAGQTRGIGEGEVRRRDATDAPVKGYPPMYNGSGRGTRINDVQGRDLRARGDGDIEVVMGPRRRIAEFNLYHVTDGHGVGIHAQKFIRKNAVLHEVGRIRSKRTGCRPGIFADFAAVLAGTSAAHRQPMRDPTLR